MDSNDPLDDFLAAKPERTWRKPKRVVKALREAYTYGVPVLQMKGHIDQMVEHTGYSFVCGTPDETLRRVVAFLLTNCESDTLASLLPLLWARGGREDIVTTGILLVNIDRASLDSDVWGVLAGLVRATEPLEGLLAVVEELYRGEHGSPDDDLLLDWFGGSPIHSCLALLCLHAGWVRSGRAPLTGHLREAVDEMNVGDSDGLLKRVRDQLLEAQ